MELNELQELMIEITVKSDPSHFWIGTALLALMTMFMCTAVILLARNAR